jgi:hypothetical protein
MSSILCQRCHREYSNKKTLLKHLIDGVVCEPIFSSRTKEELLISFGYSPRNIQCNSCNTSFKTHEALNSHLSVCPIRLQEERKELIELRTLQAKFNSQEQILHNMQNTINKLYDRCKVVSDMKLFNHENTDYIDNDPTIIIKCIKDGVDGLTNYIKLKYFNPEHKENYTLKKRTSLKIYTGVKWKSVSDEYVLSRIIEDYAFKILTYVRQNNNNSDFDMNSYESFLYNIAYPLDLDILFLDIWEIPEEDDENIKHRQQMKSLIIQRIMETIENHTRFVKK